MKKSAERLESSLKILGVVWIRAVLACVAGVRKGRVNENLWGERERKKRAKEPEKVSSPFRTSTVQFRVLRTLCANYRKKLVNSLQLNNIGYLQFLGSKGVAVVSTRLHINVSRVQILEASPYLDWVCCWFSLLLRDAPVFPLLNIQHFLIVIWSRIW